MAAGSSESQALHCKLLVGFKSVHRGQVIMLMVLVLLCERT